jgi:predicted amidohydrolase
MTTLRATAASPEVRIGDLDGNLERIRAAIVEAAAAGAQLIVLPELATSGYVFSARSEAFTNALTRDDPRWAALEAAIPGDVVVVLGYAEIEGDRLFNTAVVLGSAGRFADYRKAHLWGIEKLVFDAGPTAGIVVDVPFGRLGVAICYDSEFPEVPRKLALAGADVLALPVNWPLVPRPSGEHPPETIQAMAAARSSRLPIVIADRWGEERGVPWTDGTAIVDEKGWVIARRDGAADASGASGASGASAASAASATIALDAVRLKSLPPHNDLFVDRRPELY